MNKKQSVIDMISKFDPMDPVQAQMLNFIEANLLQFEIAKRLNHQFVDANHYDAICKKTNKLFEYKIVNTCNSPSFTVSNLNNKEDVIIFVNKGVIDSEEHWFYIPKQELETTKSPCGKFSLVDKNLTRGKMMLPKNYLSEKRRTWKKDFMVNKRVTIEQIIEMSNTSIDN